MPTIQTILETIVHSITKVRGVQAIVLGGSRARETHTSKSDIDIGIYYETEQNLDIPSLTKIAQQLDDDHRENLLTEIGGWGPWVNGGGWLTVQQIPVDFLYRDLQKVASVMDQNQAGVISIDYYVGHPHGFMNSIYMAEVALCKVLWDPTGIISSLKEKTHVYPPAMKKAIIEKFWPEAIFSIKTVTKGIMRKDISYVAGCCYRTISCLNQVLFAINQTYWMNEKGSLELIDTFAVAPKQYKARTEGIFRMFTPKDLHKALRCLEEIVQETAQIVDFEEQLT
jgi:predicted nucleotidyltransferase